MEDFFYLIYRSNLCRLRKEVAAGIPGSRQEWEMYQEAELMLGEGYYLNKEVFCKIGMLERLTEDKPTTFYMMAIDRLLFDKIYAKNMDLSFEEFLSDEKTIENIKQACEAQNEMIPFRQRCELFWESDNFGKLFLFGVYEAYRFTCYFLMKGEAYSAELQQAKEILRFYIGSDERIDKNDPM